MLRHGPDGAHPPAHERPRERRPRHALQSLEQFAAEGYIVETKCEGRRRSYVLTEKGEERLHGEMDRLTAQMNDYQRLLKGGDKPCELTDGTRSGN